MNPSTVSTVRSRSTNTTANSKKKPASLSNNNQGQFSSLVGQPFPRKLVLPHSTPEPTHFTSLNTMRAPAAYYMQHAQGVRNYGVIFPKTLYDSKLSVVKQELEINDIRQEHFSWIQKLFIQRKDYTLLISRNEQPYFENNRGAWWNISS